MQASEVTGFERSWLQDRLDPEEYFARLFHSSVAQRRSWVREQIETNQQMVREVWCEGDELRYWRFRIGGGVSGADGLALLRNGEVVQVWSNGRIL
jgi:hypothetical protein